MKMPPYQLVTFTITEGQIVYEHRYHSFVCAPPGIRRQIGANDLMDCIAPSNIGVYSDRPLSTIQESYDELRLLISIEYGRVHIGLDLMMVIRGYVSLKWTTSCAHPVIKPMDMSKHKNAPIATSVAAPSAANERLGIAMTRWSPMAQFLSCDISYQAVLQKECCLDCAAETFNGSTNGVIIVAC